MFSAGLWRGRAPVINRSKTGTAWLVDLGMEEELPVDKSSNRDRLFKKSSKLVCGSGTKKELPLDRSSNRDRQRAHLLKNCQPIGLWSGDKERIACGQVRRP